MSQPTAPPGPGFNYGTQPQQPGYGAQPYPGPPAPSGGGMYPPAGAVPYPPQAGQAPPPPTGAPKAQEAYQQQQPGYPPPNQAGYPPNQGGYPLAQGGYPPAQGGYPPAQGGYQAPPGGPPAGMAGAPPAGMAGAPPAGMAGGAGDMPPSYKGDTPNEDVMDNPNASEPTPTAPPLNQMDNIGGYNNINYDGGFLPPPSYEDATAPHAPENRGPIQNMPVITEDQARQALLEYVAQHCCFGKKAAQDMQFMDLKSSSAFHYTLETFAEGRSTAWAYEPYKGQPIDSPNNGPAPPPWSVPVQPAQKFKNVATAVEVPHTASVKPCHDCIGNGRVRCFRCHGRGRIVCHTCNGRGKETYFEDGHHRHRSCHWCHGSGRRRCYTCHGHGQVNCKTCAAKGNLKCYIKLTVTWTNHLDDHIVERTNLPDALIRGVSGQKAFEEEYPRVWPINHFPDQSINIASKQLVDKHNTAFPTERLLLQRHQVRVIPVTEACYKYKNKDDSYFVYGFEHKVHAPNYPQQCCCGCTIL